MDQNPRFLVVPDSFKGGLSAEAAGDAIRLGLNDELPGAAVDVFAMADGGEGSSSIAGKIAGAKRVDVSAHGPEGHPVPGFFYLSESKVAYIELAAASGLPLVKDRSTSARRATTFGTGELFAEAVRRGAQKIFLFVGGSATTDGGVGIAKALGYKFFDGTNRELANVADWKRGPYLGEQLREISRIEAPERPLWRGTEIFVVADVDNPLYGPRGAAAIYGPQKGANNDDIAWLDAGLKNLAQIVRRDLGVEIEQLEGTGAAGGASYGMMCFCGAKRLRGASFFLDLIGFDQRIASAAAVITGEGKCDRQSIEGKLLAEIYHRSEADKVPVISLSGIVALSLDDHIRFPRLIALGLGHVDGLSHPAESLRRLARNVAKLLAPQA